MAWRWLGAVLLVVTMVTAQPFAHAVPTDQTWRAGLYDGADYDDLVNFVTSASATTDRVGPPPLSPLRVITQLRPTGPLAAPSTHVRSPYHRRAPPAA